MFDAKRTTQQNQNITENLNFRKMGKFYWQSRPTAIVGRRNKSNHNTVRYSEICTNTIVYSLTVRIVEKRVCV